MEKSYQNFKLFILCLISISLISGVVMCVNVNAKNMTDVKASQNSAAVYEWFEVAENIYQFRYQHHYTLFVITSKGLVAFDPLSNEAAEQYVKAMKAVAPGKPLVAIIYTHWHVDHSAGAKVLKREFGENISVIAHERALARLKRWDDPEILLPTDTISDKGKVLHYGEQIIELNYIGYGHTDSMLVARFPQQELVFVVDFANNDAVGWTDLPGWYIGEMIAMQGRLLKLDFDTVAFGHGMPGNKATIKRQMGYYLNLTTYAKVALKQGLSEDEAVVSIEPKMKKYQNWYSYNDWFLQNIRGAYRWAQSSLSNK